MGVLENINIHDGVGNTLTSTANALDINLKTSAATVTVAQSTGSNLHTVVDSGTITSITDPVTVVQPTASNLHATVELEDGAGNPLTSTGSALDSNLKTVGGTSVQTGTGTSGAGIPRVTVSNDSKIQPWDGTNSAKFDATGETTADITRFGGTAVTIGQKVMASSLPIAIASDQSPIPVSGVFNIQSGEVNSGTVPGTTGGILAVTTGVSIWSTMVLDLQASGTVSPNGVFEIQGSTDGVLWFPLTGTELSDNPGQVTTYFTTGFTTSSARYNLACYPYTRVYTTQGFSGTINASMSLSTALGDEVNFSTTKLVDAGNNPISTLGSEQYTANRGITPNCYQSGSSFIPYVPPSTTSGYWGIQDYYFLPKPSQVGNTMVVVLVSPYSGGIITGGTITDSAQNVYTQISPTLTNFSYSGEVSYTSVYTAAITNVDSLGRLALTIPFGDTGYGGFELMAFEYEGVGDIDVIQVAGGSLSSTSSIDSINTGTFNTTSEDAILWLFAAQQLQGSATISSISVDSNSAPTITFTAPHPFKVGETVNFAGVTTATWLRDAYRFGDIPFTGNLVYVPAPITAITATTITLAVNGNCTTPYANTADTGTCTLVAGGPNPAVGYIMTSQLSSGQTLDVAYNSTAGTLLESATLSSFLTPNGVSAGSSLSYIQAYTSNAPTTTALNNGFGLLNCGGFSALAVAFKAAPTVTIIGGMDSTGIVRAASTDTSGNQIVVGTGDFATQAAQSGTWAVRNQDGSGNPIASTNDALNVHVLNSPVVQIQDSNGNSIATTSGALNVNVVSGSSSIAVTESTVPAAADYVGLNIGGVLVGQTGYSVGEVNCAAVALVDSVGNRVVNFGGTQYGAGANVPVPTGTVAMGTDGTDVRALSTTSAGVLNVNVTGGSTSGTQYAAGAVATPPIGTVAMGTDGTEVRALSTNSAGILNVNVTGGSTSGTQYAAGAAVPTPTGTVALGWDGADVRTLRTDAAGCLMVNLQSSDTTLTNTSGALDVNIKSGGGENAVGGINNSVPTVANYIGFSSGGVLVGVSDTIPLPVTLPTGSIITTRAQLYLGNNQVGASVPVAISANDSPQTATNPMSARLTDGTTAVSGAVSPLGTAPSGTDVMAVNSVHLPSATAGAALSSKFINATGAAANIKTSAGNLYGFSLTNATAAPVFVEFFNTNGTPSLGSTAVAFCVTIPASGNVTLSPNMPLMNFSTGIGFAVTTAENGATTAAVTGMLFFA